MTKPVIWLNSKRTQPCAMATKTGCSTIEVDLTTLRITKKLSHVNQHISLNKSRNNTRAQVVCFVSFFLYRALRPQWKPKTCCFWTASLIRHPLSKWRQRWHRTELAKEKYRQMGGHMVFRGERWCVENGSIFRSPSISTFDHAGRRRKARCARPNTAHMMTPTRRRSPLHTI